MRAIPTGAGSWLPHDDDTLHERMRCAVEGVFAGLRERVSPAATGIDETGVPRPVVRRDGVLELVVVGPADRRSCCDLDALLRKLHRSDLGLCGVRRPFAAAVFRRRFTAPPKVPAQ